MISWITTVAAWFAEKFGGKIVVFGLEKIQSKLREIFASRNILILGGEQTGKSSLISYLTTGRPYEIIRGEIRPPEKTSGYVVLDKKFDLDEHWLKIKRDVPGEEIDYWKMAIEEIQPTGIIYMIDGRLSKRKLREAIAEIFDGVLDIYVNGNGSGIEALHIFVNFADQWATTPIETRKMVRYVEEKFDDYLEKYPSLQYIKIGCSASQLSPHKDSWDETKQALYEFSARLR